MTVVTPRDPAICLVSHRKLLLQRREERGELWWRLHLQRCGWGAWQRPIGCEAYLSGAPGEIEQPKKETIATQPAQYDHIGSKYDEYARTATEKRAERYTFFRMVGALEGGLSRADGFSYEVSRTSVSSHPWVGTSALVRLASSGEGIRGGLDARR